MHQDRIDNLSRHLRIADLIADHESPLAPIGVGLGALARAERMTPTLGSVISSATSAAVNEKNTSSPTIDEQKETESNASHFAEEAVAITLLTEGAASPAEAAMVRASCGDPNKFACLVLHRLCRARVAAVAAQPQPRTANMSARSKEKKTYLTGNSMSMKMSADDIPEIAGLMGDEGDEEKNYFDDGHDNTHLASWSRFVEDLTEVAELLNHYHRKSPPAGDEFDGTTGRSNADENFDESESAGNLGAAWALRHALDLLLGAQRDDAAQDEGHNDDDNNDNVRVAATSNDSGSDNDSGESDDDGRSSSTIAGEGEENEEGAVVTILAALNRLSTSNRSTNTTSSTTAAEALVLARALSLCERATSASSACLSEARVCLASLPWSSPSLDACRRMLRAARLLALPPRRNGFGFKHCWPKLLEQAHVRGAVAIARTTSSTSSSSNWTIGTSDDQSNQDKGYFPLRDAVAFGGGGPGLAFVQAVLVEQPHMYAAHTTAADARSVSVSSSSYSSSSSSLPASAPARSFKGLFGKSRSAKDSTPAESLLPLGALKSSGSKSSSSATTSTASGVGSGLLEVATLLGMADNSIEMARAKACLAAGALSCGDLDSALHLAHGAVHYTPMILGQPLQGGSTTRNPKTNGQYNDGNSSSSSESEGSMHRSVLQVAVAVACADASTMLADTGDSAGEVAGRQRALAEATILRLNIVHDAEVAAAVAALIGRWSLLDLAVSPAVRHVTRLDAIAAGRRAKGLEFSASPAEILTAKLSKALQASPRAVRMFEVSDSQGKPVSFGWTRDPQTQVIASVQPDGQASNLGVRAEWQLVAVGDSVVSSDAEVEAEVAAARQDVAATVAMTFIVPLEDADDKIVGNDDSKEFDKEHDRQEGSEEEKTDILNEEITTTTQSGSGFAALEMAARRYLVDVSKKKVVPLKEEGATHLALLDAALRLDQLQHWHCAPSIASSAALLDNREDGRTSSRRYDELLLALATQHLNSATSHLAQSSSSSSDGNNNVLRSNNSAEMGSGGGLMASSSHCLTCLLALSNPSEAVALLDTTLQRLRIQLDEAKAQAIEVNVTDDEDNTSRDSADSSGSRSSTANTSDSRPTEDEQVGTNSSAWVEPDPALVSQLQQMGFEHAGARRSAAATGNAPLEVALQWAIAHAGDSDFNLPLVRGWQQPNLPTSAGASSSSSSPSSRVDGKSSSGSVGSGTGVGGAKHHSTKVQDAATAVEVAVSIALRFFALSVLLPDVSSASEANEAKDRSSNDSNMSLSSSPLNSKSVIELFSAPLPELVLAAARKGPGCEFHDEDTTTKTMTMTIGATSTAPDCSAANFEPRSMSWSSLRDHFYRSGGPTFGRIESASKGSSGASNANLATSLVAQVCAWPQDTTSRATAALAAAAFEAHGTYDGAIATATTATAAASHEVAEAATVSLKDMVSSAGGSTVQSQSIPVSTAQAAHVFPSLPLPSEAPAPEVSSALALERAEVAALVSKWLPNQGSSSSNGAMNNNNSRALSLAFDAHSCASAALAAARHPSRASLDDALRLAAFGQAHCLTPADCPTLETQAAAAVATDSSDFSSMDNDVEETPLLCLVDPWRLPAAHLCTLLSDGHLSTLAKRTANGTEAAAAAAVQVAIRGDSKATKAYPTNTSTVATTTAPAVSSSTEPSSAPSDLKKEPTMDVASAPPTVMELVLRPPGYNAPLQSHQLGGPCHDFAGRTANLLRHRWRSAGGKRLALLEVLCRLLADTSLAAAAAANANATDAPPDTTAAMSENTPISASVAKAACIEAQESQRRQSLKQLALLLRRLLAVDNCGGVDGCLDLEQLVNCTAAIGLENGNSGSSSSSSSKESSIQQETTGSETEGKVVGELERSAPWWVAKMLFQNSTARLPIGPFPTLPKALMPKGSQKLPPEEGDTRDSDASSDSASEISDDDDDSLDEEGNDNTSSRSKGPYASDVSNDDVGNGWLASSERASEGQARALKLAKLCSHFQPSAAPGGTSQVLRLFLQHALAAAARQQRDRTRAREQARKDEKAAAAAVAAFGDGLGGDESGVGRSTRREEVNQITVGPFAGLGRLIAAVPPPLQTAAGAASNSTSTSQPNSDDDEDDDDPVQLCLTLYMRPLLPKLSPQDLLALLWPIAVWPPAQASMVAAEKDGGRSKQLSRQKLQRGLWDLHARKALATCIPPQAQPPQRTQQDAGDAWDWLLFARGFVCSIAAATDVFAETEASQLAQDTGEQRFTKKEAARNTRAALASLEACAGAASWDGQDSSMRPPAAEALLAVRTAVANQCSQMVTAGRWNEAMTERIAAVFVAQLPPYVPPKGMQPTDDPLLLLEKARVAKEVDEEERLRVLAADEAAAAAEAARVEAEKKAAAEAEEEEEERLRVLAADEAAAAAAAEAARVEAQKKAAAEAEAEEEERLRVLAAEEAEIGRAHV